MKIKKKVPKCKIEIEILVSKYKEEKKKKEATWSIEDKIKLRVINIVKEINNLVDQNKVF